ncbi:MAG: hypothetical protein EBZ87_06485 [Microbacteriaceae bacterium]|jgi:hypothetical protein|nr:hypothetical protein [Microbacteriaceae bacterium]
MKESGNYYQDNNSFWNYVKDNPGIVNLPVSESKGLDLLSALRDIREAYIKNAEQGDSMLTLLGSLLVGVIEGHGDVMVEEVLVSEAMAKFDSQIKGVLDEGC